MQDHIKLERGRSESTMLAFYTVGSNPTTFSRLTNSEGKRFWATPMMPVESTE